MSLSEKNRETLERLEKAEQRDEEKDSAELAAQLSIRERLMRRLKSNKVKVTFNDDLGPFDIEVRLLSPNEQTIVSDTRIKLLRFREELAKAPRDISEIQKLEKRGNELLQELYKLVAEICVDKTLDFTYWKQGKGFNIDVPMKILNDAVLASQRTEADTASFRPE